jgi:REP element-mobilizing transposase RayT
MARPIRVDVEDGVYHVISRGIDRQNIFREDADRIHFLDRLAEAQRRFRLSVYGYVLMNNHFHLIVATPDANLSRAMQWLKVSYSMWFNAKYRRVGPLFQGRFKGVLVDCDENWLLELSLYVHMNPVRVQALGLNKKDQALEAKGWVVPSPKVVKERLSVLRTYRWSSYPYYAGYKRKSPPWLDVGAISKMTGSPAAYRRLVESRVSNGVPEEFLSLLKNSVALGGERFLNQVRDLCTLDRESAGKMALRCRCGWGDIVAAIEQVKGVPWDGFAGVRGDWGRAASYYLARKYAGMTLAEIGNAAGGVDYAAVSAMEKRFEKKLMVDKQLIRQIKQVELVLNIET